MAVAEGGRSLGDTMIDCQASLDEWIERMRTSFLDKVDGAVSFLPASIEESRKAI